MDFVSLLVHEFKHFSFPNKCTHVNFCPRIKIISIDYKRTLRKKIKIKFFDHILISEIWLSEKSIWQMFCPVNSAINDCFCALIVSKLVNFDWFSFSQSRPSKSLKSSFHISVSIIKPLNFVNTKFLGQTWNSMLKFKTKMYVDKVSKIEK